MDIFTRRKRLDAYIDGDYADLLYEARERFAAASEADEDQREREIQDLAFLVPENQWPEDVRSDRDLEGRPCLSIDRTSPFVNQVVNGFRQNRPQPSVNPVGDGADKETAEVLQGMIRHIAYLSNGDTAVDTAFESMVRCGRGFLRVLTEYKDEGTFDQEISIKRIPNVHMVVFDPAFQEPDGSDAEFAFLGSWVPRDVYVKEYPDSKLSELDEGTWKALGQDAPKWMDKKDAGTLVVEYFRKVRKPIKVHRLKDGRTVKSSDLAAEDKAQIEDTRDSYATEVQWFKMNAVEILDQTVWPGKYIPIIPFLGSELIVDGKRIWTGLVRPMMDAQRSYNYWKSAQAETIALAPRAPWVGPKGFMGNMKHIWAQVNRKPIAALEYEAYDSNQRPLPPPQRNMIEPPIAAITQAMVGAVDDLKATTGMYDPSLGNREASQSGVAIRQLQQQGQIGQFHLADNASRSIRHLGRVLIDLIPKIYDTQRVERIINPDDTTALVTLNGPPQPGTNQNAPIDPQTGIQKIYDVTVGTYDVTVSVGPSYQTRRQENLALLESLMQGPMGQLLTQTSADLIVSMMDFAIAPELQERLKKAIPPQFQDQPQGQAQIPPQFQQQMQAIMAQHQQLTQALNKAQDEIQQQAQKYQAQITQAQIEAETKLKIAEIEAQAEVLAAQARGQEPAGQPQIAEFLKEMGERLENVESLALAHHESLTPLLAEPVAPSTAGAIVGKE